ncbi:MAG: hypothetical protein CBE09_02680 [Rhizobiales bacterium TMED249]|uniref:Cell division protein FtsL n=1 Tax=PS1 clade bacterium TaxID=2175152 RepID=A0A368E311_9PROT|nr:MAG: hypothetical protein CBE09_02680 [Rhizobiales bacterium TMED249]RCL77933.1 MAG: hypothetical protein DBW69_02000 [PS1 clade bacterium]HAK98652.1 hypothetical protein [Rhodobiaceae bacterium]HCV49039.1 hypothetical protein [Rhodobiaceae bacterium]|tara:strand:+ start:831 stop:1208 length:378 start_codon:yes stop_codon:yes gene_type:complete
MIRLVNMIIFIAVILLFAAVYHIRYGADAEHKAIRNAERAIEKEKITRRILEAEWVSLNNPARLEKLSEMHLRLEPLAATQIRTPDSFFVSEEDQIIQANIKSDDQENWQNGWTVSGERGGLDAR